MSAIIARMKIVCVVSALDIQLNYGCTPAWWQFLKGLHELGHDVVAIPYAGGAFATPWWRCYANPCQTEGSAFGALKKMFRKSSGGTSTSEGASGVINRKLIESWVRPRWEAQLAKVLETERNVDAVIVFSVPLNHFTGLPSRLRTKYGVPFYFFDGDVPASLPKFGGFASGFRGYDGADLREYDGFMCNSTAGAEELTAMGARRVETVHWGVDPELYSPMMAKEEFDVFFYGYGVEYREEWFEDMLVTPCGELADKKFALGGKGFPPTPIALQYVGNVPFNGLRQACARAKINLNISRTAHASVYGSSTLRMFELAAMGCCIVSNPHEGIEEWFDDGKEIVIVESADDAIRTYRRLLQNARKRKAMGRAARKRVLSEHTHLQRAEQIVEFIRR
ncbi:MAG: glycosyltransferase [Candidatus Hydrogenedentes bacterium]|nr:glycosyltransferase [Candidatus Hydrogenedentota bacterium]